MKTENVKTNVYYFKTTNIKIQTMNKNYKSISKILK